MRKIILFAAVLALVACNKTSEFHQTYVVETYKVAFADQTVDSVDYVTTEVHSLSSNQPWCHVDNSYQASINQQIKAHPGIYQLKTYLTLEPNTTGALRTAAVTVDGGEYSASAMIVQLHSLEVARPSVVLSPDLSTDSISTLYLAGTASTDSIAFRTNFPWELSVAGDSFVTLEKTDGQAGVNVVRFTYGQNPLDETRSTKIMLTSAAGPDGSSRITTTIPVVQAKKPALTSN